MSRTSSIHDDALHTVAIFDSAADTGGVVAYEHDAFAMHDDDFGTSSRLLFRARSLAASLSLSPSSRGIYRAKCTHATQWQ